MKRLSQRWAIGALAVLAGLILPPTARGCATAPSPGVRVDVVGEEAVILWDAARHTEHFTRRADFQSQAAQFGFLVPTPSPPRLAEADDTIFDELADAVQPQYVRRPVYGLKLTSLLNPFAFEDATTRAGLPATLAVAPAAVSVVDVERVAGYDATVLKADDAVALAAWLRAHGYQARPALAAWLQPYVARHWAVTAFKIARRDARSPTFGSGTVRMSFTTDRPFFPYREPADQRTGGLPSRRLRIYFLSDARADGALDDAGVQWPGRAQAAQTLGGDFLRELPRLTDLPKAQAPQSLWMTTFLDTSSPRPGVADLYFARSARQTPLVPTVFVPVDRRVGVPIEWVFAAGALVVALGAGLRRAGWRGIALRRGRPHGGAAGRGAGL